MKLHIFILVFAVLFMAVCTGNKTTDYPVQPEPDSPVDPFELNEKLGRGLNLGNALEAPDIGEWGMTIEEEYIQLISDAGFDAVRIPIRWNAHAAESEPYTIRRSFLAVADEVIKWSLDRDLLVVFNIHHYDELMDNPYQHKERFLSIWKQLSEHYHDLPNEVVFEILNEPHGNLTAELWNPYLAQAIDVIRKSNPYRTIMVGTAPWGGIDGLQNLELPEDDQNLIVTVHYYNPFRFTHQGAEWVGEEADEWLGTTWTGTNDEKKAVNNDFDTVKEWGEDHSRPIHVGEFGAYNAAPEELRELWTRYIREALEERDFSWAYWEFGSGFGVYDREKEDWRKGLLEALIPDSPEL